MNTLILGITGSVLACGGFWTLIQFLITRKDNKKKAVNEIKDELKEIANTINILIESNEKQNNIIKALAQENLVRLARECLTVGTVSSELYVTLKQIADAYRELGWDGLVKDYMDRVDKLPRSDK